MYDDYFSLVESTNEIVYFNELDAKIENYSESILNNSVNVQNEDDNYFKSVPTRKRVATF